MAAKFVNEISIAYDLVKKPGDVGHAFGPRKPGGHLE
jgi:hypothetical protein